MSDVVIFDVDGTLVDNSYQHTLAWLRACNELGIERTAAELHRLVGMGADQYVPALLGHDLPELAEAHDRHMEPLQRETRPLPGAGQLVVALRRLGVRVAVATSSERDTAVDLISRALPDLSLVDIIVTRDDVAASKPAPDVVAVALERSGAAPERTVMVGDTGWDVAAAGRSGVPCVAVRTGGWGDAELREAGAVAVYDTLATLLDALPVSPLAAP